MAEIATILPWVVLFLVFVGMAALQWRVIGALDQALARGQGLTPSPVPIVPAKPIPPAPIPAPAPLPVPPKPSGPFPDAPLWFHAALAEIGFHETGDNQGLDRYIQMAHCGANGEPWCAIFANAMLESSGVPGSRSPSSQSFRTHPAFVQLSGPALGAIVVYWRISQSSGQGHVGFYRGEDASRVWTLGGNENDMVQIEALPKTSASFGLIGYWWPKSVALPAIGPVLMPAGSPVSMQTPPAGIAATPASPAGKQIGITATVFGGPKSAYGGPIIDTQPGVALPYRFVGVRPKVIVTRQASGKSVTCDIVDIGPWNGISADKSDPYWTTGTRPQAETGTDLNGRHTNKAGIDLTLAAANAIGVDGKALVSWQFAVPTVQPAQIPPVVT